MPINYADAAVQAAIISAVANIVAAVVAAICAAVIGHQIAGRRRLKEKLHLAVNDLQFMLAVEKFHCGKHEEQNGTSLKITMRKLATEAGERWSGKFTPSSPTARAASQQTIH